MIPLRKFLLLRAEGEIPCGYYDRNFSCGTGSWSNCEDGSILQLWNQRPDPNHSGMSRDDSGSFLPNYTELEVVSANPFASVDQTGVGQLMEIAVKKGNLRCGIKLWICGEHGGDPSSGILSQNWIELCKLFSIPLPTARLAAHKLQFNPFEDFCSFHRVRLLLRSDPVSLELKSPVFEVKEKPRLVERKVFNFCAFGKRP